MRYTDCTGEGNCNSCSLSNYNKDCHNNPTHPLAYQRTINNLSQSQLAEKANISVRTIQDIEQGHRDINKVAGITLYVIAKACNCTIEDLLEI